MDLKERANVTFIGPVSSGKSTTIGQIIYKCGGVAICDFEKLEQNAIDEGKSASKFAWIMDTLETERQRGISIEISNKRFETARFQVNVVDTPGHVKFVKNMIPGFSEADCAILVVSAAPEEFEAGVSSGQTMEHAILAYAMGVRRLIVAVNKMDVVEWSQERFQEISAKMQKILKKFGSNFGTVAMIPISGWLGDNLIESSTNMPWWGGIEIQNRNGTTLIKTLFDSIDDLEPVVRPANKPLRISIQDRFRTPGLRGTAAGFVASGTVEAGMIVTVMPSKERYTICSVQVHHNTIPKGTAGDNVAVRMADCFWGHLHRGQIISDSQHEPAKEAASFVAQIVIVGHPTQICVGYAPVVSCHTARVTCKFSEILAKIDRRTNEVIEEFPKVLKTGDIALVKMVPLNPLCVETFAEYPSLGRIVVRDSRSTVAFGVIKEVENIELVPPVKTGTRRVSRRSNATMPVDKHVRAKSGPPGVPGTKIPGKPFKNKYAILVDDFSAIR